VATIRVLVCDDSDAFRALLRYTLQEDPGIEVVGEAADGMAAIHAAERLQPDVVLLDLTMPILDRMERAALDQGALSYVEKTDDVQAIRDAVRSAAAGA
jgi:chemotaxis response regulator CheB